MSRHSDAKRDAESAVELESQFILRLPSVCESFVLSIEVWLDFS